MTPEPTVYSDDMPREIEPNDPDREQELGRVALWLDPEDLRWLSTRCECPPDASEEQTERCARVRFRASTALHKVGLSA